MREETDHTREDGEQELKKHRSGWSLVDQRTDYDLVDNLVFTVDSFVFVLEHNLGE